jgi:hypothetical protein
MKHQLKHGDTLANVTAEQLNVIKEIAEIRGIEVCSYFLKKGLSAFPNIIIVNGIIAGLAVTNTDNEISFETFISKMLGTYKDPNIEVVLNDSHTAIVSKDSIKVGCQTFTHEAIERLYNASKEATK